MDQSRPITFSIKAVKSHKTGLLIRRRRRKRNAINFESFSTTKGPCIFETKLSPADIRERLRLLHGTDVVNKSSEEVCESSNQSQGTPETDTLKEVKTHLPQPSSLNEKDELASKFDVSGLEQDSDGDVRLNSPVEDDDDLYKDETIPSPNKHVCETILRSDDFNELTDRQRKRIDLEIYRQLRKAKTANGNGANVKLPTSPRNLALITQGMDLNKYLDMSKIESLTKKLIDSTVLQNPDQQNLTLFMDLVTPQASKFLTESEEKQLNDLIISDITQDWEANVTGETPTTMSEKSATNGVKSMIDFDTFYGKLYTFIRARSAKRLKKSKFDISAVALINEMIEEMNSLSEQVMCDNSREISPSCTPSKKTCDVVLFRNFVTPEVLNSLPKEYKSNLNEMVIHDVLKHVYKTAPHKNTAVEARKIIASGCLKDVLGVSAFYTKLNKYMRHICKKKIKKSKDSDCVKQEMDNMMSDLRILQMTVPSSPTRQALKVSIETAPETQPIEGSQAPSSPRGQALLNSIENASNYQPKHSEQSSSPSGKSPKTLDTQSAFLTKSRSDCKPPTSPNEEAPPVQSDVQFVRPDNIRLDYLHNGLITREINAFLTDPQKEDLNDIIIQGILDYVNNRKDLDPVKLSHQLLRTGIGISEPHINKFYRTLNRYIKITYSKLDVDCSRITEIDSMMCKMNRHEDQMIRHFESAMEIGEDSGTESPSSPTFSRPNSPVPFRLEFGAKKKHIQNTKKDKNTIRLEYWMNREYEKDASRMEYRMDQEYEKNKSRMEHWMGEGHEKNRFRMENWQGEEHEKNQYQMGYWKGVEYEKNQFRMEYWMGAEYEKNKSLGEEYEKNKRRMEYWMGAEYEKNKSLSEDYDKNKLRMGYWMGAEYEKKSLSEDYDKNKLRMGYWMGAEYEKKSLSEDYDKNKRRMEYWMGAEYEKNKSLSEDYDKNKRRMEYWMGAEYEKNKSLSEDYDKNKRRMEYWMGAEYEKNKSLGEEHEKNKRRMEYWMGAEYEKNKSLTEDYEKNKRRMEYWTGAEYAKNKSLSEDYEKNKSLGEEYEKNKRLMEYRMGAEYVKNKSLSEDYEKNKRRMEYWTGAQYEKDKSLSEDYEKNKSLGEELEKNKHLMEYRMGAEYEKNKSLGEEHEKSKRLMEHRMGPAYEKQPEKRKDTDEKTPKTNSGKETGNSKKLSGRENFEDYLSFEDAESGLLNGELVKGTIRINPKNSKVAYVNNTDSRERDYVIDSMLDRNRALEGDQVVLRIKPETEWVDDCKTATVVHILKQVHPRTAVGRLVFTNLRYDADFYPRDLRFPILRIPRIFWPVGFHVHPDIYADVIFLAKLTSWEKNRFPSGLLLEVFGRNGDLNAETNAILRDLSLDVTPFPQSFDSYLPKTAAIGPEEVEGRVNLRGQCIFTVDPATARDLDDAVSCRGLPNGNVEVGVHIADVSYYLAEDTPLDQLVRERATTVYLADKAFHMLPPALTLHCSLLPARDKLTVSVVWEMTMDGEVVSTKFERTVINSCAQLSYEQAQRMIDEPERKWAPADGLPQPLHGYTAKDLSAAINVLHWLAVKMRKRRMENGALRIDQVKVSFELHPTTGQPVSLFHQKQTDAHRMIEEFMLLANISVAERIHKEYPDLAFLRCHEPPKVHMLTELQQNMKQFGMFIDISTSKNIRLALEKYDEDEFYIRCSSTVLNHLVTKPMVRARYYCAGHPQSEQELKHYALSVPLYTHFTSPIRRYADIMVHRLLTACLGFTQKPAWQVESVAAIAENCNDKKYKAMKAGQMSNDLYLIQYVEANQPCLMYAVVIDVKERSYDVLILDTGNLIRMFFDRLAPDVMVKKQCLDKKDSLTAAEEDEEEEMIAGHRRKLWKHTVRFPMTKTLPEVDLVIQMFSVIKVALSKSPKKQLALEARLLRPVPKPVEVVDMSCWRQWAPPPPEPVKTKRKRRKKPANTTVIPQL